MGKQRHFDPYFNIKKMLAGILILICYFFLVGYLCKKINGRVFLCVSKHVQFLFLFPDQNNNDTIIFLLLSVQVHGRVVDPGGNPEEEILLDLQYNPRRVQGVQYIQVLYCNWVHPWLTEWGYMLNSNITLLSLTTCSSIKITQCTYILKQSIPKPYDPFFLHCTKS